MTTTPTSIALVLNGHDARPDDGPYVLETWAGTFEYGIPGEFVAEARNLPDALRRLGEWIETARGPQGYPVEEPAM